MLSSFLWVQAKQRKVFKKLINFNKFFNEM